MFTSHLLFVSFLDNFILFFYSFPCFKPKFGCLDFSVCYSPYCKSVPIRLLIMSVRLNLLFPTVSTVYALLNGFLLLIVNWSLMKQIGMLYLYNRDKQRWKKTFCWLLPRIDPRTTSLRAVCITNWSNLSFCLLFRICLCLSNYLFSLFSFVPRQLNSLFLLLFRALSLILVAKRDSSVCYSLYCHNMFAYKLFYHVSPPMIDPRTFRLYMHYPLLTCHVMYVSLHICYHFFFRS